MWGNPNITTQHLSERGGTDCCNLLLKHKSLGSLEPWNSWKSQQQDGTRMTDSLQDHDAVHTMHNQVFSEVPCDSSSSPRRYHSTCWGLTGLGAGNSMTPRLGCHLLNHHHCYPWQFGDIATEFETKAATPEVFKLCRISNHKFKRLNLEIMSSAAPEGVKSAVSQQLIPKKDRFD